MGEMEQKISGDDIDRLANLSDANLNAAAAQLTSDLQQRALLVRRVRQRRQQWKQNLEKAQAEEAKLPHNTAAEPDAKADAIPQHNKVHYDDDDIVIEKDEKKSKSSADAEKLSASHERTATHTEKDGETEDKKERTVKGTAGISGASGGFESSKEHKEGEGASALTTVSKTSGDAKFDWEKGAGDAKLAREKEVKVGEGANATAIKTSTAGTGKLDLSKGSGELGLSRENEVESDGKSHKAGHEATIGYEDGHVQLGGGMSRENKVVDEKTGAVTSSSSTEAKGHISTAGGGFDLSHSETDAAGTKATIGGGADVNWKEGTGSAHLNSGVKTKSGDEMHASLSAGISVEAGEPKKVGDHWEVAYKITHSLGAGAGGTKGKAGGEISAKDEHYEMGTRSFKDETEAKEFKEHVKEKIGEAPSTNSVEGAMALEVGETRGMGSSAGGSIGVTGQFEGVKAGVSGHESASEDLTVERVSEKIFRVTYRAGEEKGIDGSLGGGPLTTSAGSSSEQHAGYTVEFDLSTKEGKEGYLAFQKNPKQPVKGGKHVSDQSGLGHENHDGTAIAGVGTAKYGRHTGEEKVVDAKGTHQGFEGDQSHSVDPSWAGKHIFGDDKVHSSVQIDAKVENGKDDGFTVTGNVSGESGKYNRGKMQALSSGLVEHENWDESKAGPSGDWTMTADIDKKTMASLEHYSDKFRGKSKDDQMRALGEWVADDGSKAVQSIERWSGKALNWDLELKGDKNFPGRAGRLELEAKIRAYGEQLSKNPASATSLEGQLEGEIAALHDRRKAVEKPDKYTDLPDGLRAQQLRLIDSQIAGFEAVRHRALVEGDKNKPGETINQIGARGEKGEGPLAKARDEIAMADSAIAGYQKQNGDGIAAMTKAMQHLDFSKKGAAARVNDANKMATAAAAKDAAQRAAYPKLDEQRTALMKSAASPDAALPIAQKLLADLTQQSLLAGEAQTLLSDAGKRLYVVTNAIGRAGHEEFWNDIVDSLDGEDVADEDEAEASHEEEKEPPLKPTAMALDEPKRRR